VVLLAKFDGQQTVKWRIQARKCIYQCKDQLLLLHMHTYALHTQMEESSFEGGVLKCNAFS